MELIRYKLTVAYRGTAYHGWQRQIVAGDDTGAMELPTVQNALRLALQRTVGHEVNVVGSSRTDSGVHALGQVASFTTIRHQMPPEKLVMATNAKLPADVAVTAADRVPDDFNVIADTVEKAYRYTIHNAFEKDVFSGDTSFHFPPRPQPLDIDAMQAAADLVVGTHDFASFAKPGHGRDSTVRTVTAATVSRNGPRVYFDIHGKGFLWHQVRILTGTLIEVGQGKRQPADLRGVLDARHREVAGPTSPPHGLRLEWVRHEEQEP
jgi:tRNA pseudouridine38-40 synthase